MRKFGYLLTAGLVTAGLALTGCSAGGSGDSGSDGGSAAPEAGLMDINAQPRDKIKDGGKLRFSITQMPTNWNLLTTDGNNVDNTNISYFTVTNNWIFDEKGNYTPNKDMLESYDVQPAEGDKPQVVTLHLNPKAKWNNGNPITWEDYQAVWKACNGENEEFKPASTDGYNQISSIEKGEKDTDVVVTFKSSYPDWASVLDRAVPAESVATPADFNDAWAGDEFHPEWQAGPFVVDSVDQSQKVVKLVPNDKWWGEKPKLEEITFRVLDDSATAQAFANNEIDVVPGMISADQYQTAQRRPDGEIRSAGGRQWRHFTLNSKAKHLDDLKVRQAIQLAANREVIAKSDLAGLPVEPAKLMLGNHFFMTGQAGYEDNGKEWSYDPERAKKLLDEAGWKLPEGKEIREKDGEPLDIEYLAITGVFTSENEGKLLQNDLKAVGINLVFKQVESGKFFDAVIGGDFAVTSFTWQGTQYPMANVGQIYGTDQESNFSGLSVPKVDELREQIQVEADHDKRVKLTNEVDKVIWENVFNIPIYRRTEFTAVPKNLANFGSFGMSNIQQTENIGFME